MDRAEKERLVAFYGDVFASAGAIVVAHYAGLNVAELGDLRRALQAEGGQLKVIKNRLVRRAIPENIIDISPLFVGPTALMWSDDPVVAPKVTAQFAKNNENVIILGGLMGTQLLDAAGVKNLASLPSLDELRGKLIGIVNAPAAKIANVCVAPSSQLARLVAARPEAA